MYPVVLIDTDDGDDDTYYRHRSIHDADERFQQQILTFLRIFHFISLLLWKFSECTHSGERRTAYRFG